MNEADTCRNYVVPLLQAAGWDAQPHRINEQVTFTDGRIILAGRQVKRGGQKRADYILRYTRDLPLAVVEAKAGYRTPADGLQQAKDYAEVLDLKFAYATNGHGIVEFDYLTGRGAPARRLPAAGRAVATAARRDGSDGGRPRAPAHAAQPPDRQAAALLPGDRRQPHRAGDAGAASSASW